MQQKTQRTALITGASAGIGAVYAEKLAHRGYDLVLVARDKARLETLGGRLSGETGRKIDVLPTDLTDRTQIARVEERIAQDKSLTLLVNNAGMSTRAMLGTAEQEGIERMLSLNVVATTILAGAAVRAFLERKSGAIVNVSSVLALAPELFDAVYSSTKAFVLSLTQGLAKEVGDSGIYVQAVLPGPIRTELWERSGRAPDMGPPEWFMPVEDLVDAALVGFDRKEIVTIPTLHDEILWSNLQTARLIIQSQLAGKVPAARYKTV